MKEFLFKKRYTKQEIKHGCMLPAFYGFAYREYDKDYIVAYPMPFNLLVRIIRGIYLFLRHGWHEVAADPREAYAQGKNDRDF